MNTVTREQIAFDLSLCGISRGDVILMHSSLSSIGFVEGGADAVIDAVLDVLGPEGTFAASTLAISETEAFDPARTPSTVGKISETMRARPGAQRSWHPVHSIVALGARAEELCAGHGETTGCGEGSPYLKLRDMGGKVVLLGVDMNRNTTLHAIEDLMDSCYLEELSLPAPVYVEDFRSKTVLIKKFPPGHRDFLRFTPVLRRAGALTEGRCGRAVVKVIDAAKMIDLGLEILQNEPMFFMCDNAACEYCAQAHQKFRGEVQV